MKFTIITAGGVGKRMNSDIPKQFIRINKIPVLFYTIDIFAKSVPDSQILITLPKDFISAWSDLLIEFNFQTKHRIIEGGQTRFDSVKNALSCLPDSGLVAIHDGVRPFVSKETILKCFQKAKELGNAVPVMDISDSIRKIENGANILVNRDMYKRVCTPQVFDVKLIKTAYNTTYREEFTDCSGILETLGYKINLVESNPENIKITKPVDLIFGEAFINSGFSDYF